MGDRTGHHYPGTELGGQAAPLEFSPGPALGSSQEWGAPEDPGGGPGESPTLIVPCPEQRPGGRTSEPEPQAEVPSPPAEPHHCPHGQAWAQCVGPRGSAHLPAGCCIWRLHTRLRKRAAASCWFSTQDMGQ